MTNESFRSLAGSLGGWIMKREEILEKSREENGGQDLFEKEVLREGGEL